MAMHRWTYHGRQNDVAAPDILPPNYLCPLKSSNLVHRPDLFLTSPLFFATTVSTRFLVQGCQLAVPCIMMPRGKNRSNKSAVKKTTTAIMASDPADEVVERFDTDAMTMKEISSIGRSPLTDDDRECCHVEEEGKEEITSIGRSPVTHDDKDCHVGEEGKRQSIFNIFPFTPERVSTITTSPDSEDFMDCYLEERDERHSVRFSDETEEFVYNGAESAAAKYWRRRRMLREPAAAFVYDDEGCFSMQIDAVGESLEAAYKSMETALRRISGRKRGTTISS
jgi:hypothetical protein